MTKNMTEGSPIKLILGFGIPVLFGNLFQQLYNVVDTAIVGKTLGEHALAAVGSTGSISFLVIGFCMGICGGFAIPVAQQFGAGKAAEVRRSVVAGVWLTALFGILLTILTVLTCGRILQIMNTPQEIYQQAHQYIITIFAGLPAYFLYNYCAGILRALGDSRTPVMWLIVSSVVNIIMDVLFILGFHMDVFGAALATVISQVLAGAGCLIRMRRGFPILSLEKEDWRINKQWIKNLCVMGLPMGLQYSITAIGSVMIQSAVNGLGTDYVAAVTAASKVSMLLSCPLDALGVTMASYGGQNTGAAQSARLRQGLRASTLLGAGYSLAALITAFLCGDFFAMLFLDADGSDLLPLCCKYLRISASFYFPLALVNIFRFYIQGMGFPPLATLAGFFELAARAGISLLVPALGYPAACFASPTAWLMADLFLIPAWFSCMHKLENSWNTTQRKKQRHIHLPSA